MEHQLFIADIYCIQCNREQGLHRAYRLGSGEMVATGIAVRGRHPHTKSYISRHSLYSRAGLSILASSLISCDLEQEASFQCREGYPWWDFLDNKRKANIDMPVFLVQNNLAWGISQEGAKWTEYYLRAKLQEVKGLSTMKENIEQGGSTSPSRRSHN